MLTELYKNIYGVAPDEINPFTPAGSNRRYFRLRGPKDVVGVVGTSVDENEAFIYLSRHFCKKGLPVPEVKAVSKNRLCYLQEDLGDMSLFEKRDDSSFLRRAVAILPDFQYFGAEGLDFNKCYPVKEFDSLSIMWDLNYFKYCFLNTTGVTYNETRLEKEFKDFAEKLSVGNYATFMYRDFQSRNIMVKSNELYFIDFQGGRRGPAEYDIVSFTTQARAGFSDELRTELIDVYLESVSRYTDVDKSRFYERIREFSLLRFVQVLGAYGFRGRFEHKQHFLASIPQALDNLKSLIRQPFDEYPYLSYILDDMISKEQESQQIKGQPIDIGPLTVTVCSFSYKKGIPVDNSGNGGGFVFDCRGMENPGRYEEYKKLTGLDKPVIDFLECKGEIQPFLNNCFGLIDPSIECYLRRGFTSLVVNFGCTGGQHRSVYSAQKTAWHIKNKYPSANVHLIHREQNIDNWL